MPRFSPLGNYVAARNGLFMEFSTPIFKARIPSRKGMYLSPTDLPTDNTLGLADLDKVVWDTKSLQPMLEYRVPPPPEELLDEIVTFFRWVAEQNVTEVVEPVLSKVPVEDGTKAVKYQNVDLLVVPPKEDCPTPVFSGAFAALSQREALVWMTYTPEDGWDMTWPEQETYGGSIWARPITAEDNVGMVIHSHGNMNAFFSPTDNQDEQFGFLYGVVGNLNKPSPIMKTRVGFAGEYMEVTNVFS